MISNFTVKGVVELLVTPSMVQPDVPVAAYKFLEIGKLLRSESPFAGIDHHTPGCGALDFGPTAWDTSIAAITATAKITPQTIIRRISTSAG